LQACLHLQLRLLDALRDRLQLAQIAGLLRTIQRSPQAVSLTKRDLFDTRSQIGDAGGRQGRSRYRGHE
jgi:hypothetical protein